MLMFEVKLSGGTTLSLFALLAGGMHTKDSQFYELCESTFAFAWLMDLIVVEKIKEHEISFLPFFDKAKTAKTLRLR